VINTLKRILGRERKIIAQYERANPKVCMVVWNTFVTDARVTREAKSLIELGREVTVIAVHEPGKTRKQEVKDGIRIIRVKRPFVSGKINTKFKPEQATIIKRPTLKMKAKYWLKPMIQLSIKWLIGLKFLYYAIREKAGVYHAHDLNTLIPVYIASRMRGTRLVYDAHEISTDRAGWGNKKIWQLVEKILIRRADEVITTNLTRAEYLRSIYEIPLPTIVHNVPNYISLQRTNLLREKLNIPDSKPILLYQGGIQRERGLETLIEAMEWINPSAVLVFIGNGSLKHKLIYMVDQLNLKSRVYFMDAVPMDQLLYYTASADIGMQVLQNTCFNHYSACSNKLFEYIMAGIPVIASDLPEMRKIIETSMTGLLIDPRDPRNIADAVNRLLEDKELYQTFSRNTREASKIYNWENEKHHLQKLYS